MNDDSPSLSVVSHCRDRWKMSATLTKSLHRRSRFWLHPRTPGSYPTTIRVYSKILLTWPIGVDTFLLLLALPISLRNSDDRSEIDRLTFFFWSTKFFPVWAVDFLSSMPIIFHLPATQQKERYPSAVQLAFKLAVPWRSLCSFPSPLFFHRSLSRHKHTSSIVV